MSQDFECPRCGHCCQAEVNKEAMKLALEALESDPISHAGLVSRKQAITAMRQALEEKQEPVAYVSSLDFDDDDQEIIPAKDKGKLGTSNCDIPLYTAPPKQWVGLTEEEREFLLHQALKFYDTNAQLLSFIKTVEEKLKEKNQ